MVVQIQIRRDSAADWTSNDPTLGQGEFGYETDTGKLKVGDGATAWTALAYIGLGQEIVEDWIGAMVTGNTETFIVVTYQDADGTLDFVVPVLDEDNMVSDSATKLATQQSIKAYADSVGGGDAFKTITGITNDVVADASDDTLTLSSANNRITIVGIAATDTITFTLVEANIDHDALANFDANEHKLEAAIDHDALTNTHNLTTDIFTASDINPILTGRFFIKDADDANETLFDFDTDDRELTIGASDGNDDIDVKIYGPISVVDSIPEAAVTAHEAAIDHDALTNFAANEHVVLPGTIAAVISDMLDEDNMVSDSATQVASQQSIKAYTDKANMIGSANSAWIPCLIATADSPSKIAACISVYNVDNTNLCVAFWAPIPTNRGGLSLYIKGMKLNLFDADANNYLDTFVVYKTDEANFDIVQTENTNRTTQGSHITTFGAVSCSNRDGILARINIVVDTATNWDTFGVFIDCYYA